MKTARPQATPAHTPGPWTCHSGSVYVDGPNVFPKGSENGVPIAHMDRDTPETAPWERDANARLIAQAPALLAALEDIASRADALAEQVPNPRPLTFIADRARAAIAAARGGGK